jgi:hypothetical protein
MSDDTTVTISVKIAPPKKAENPTETLSTTEIYNWPTVVFTFDTNGSSDRETLPLLQQCFGLQTNRKCDSGTCYFLWYDSSSEYSVDGVSAMDLGKENLPMESEEKFGKGNRLYYTGRDCNVDEMGKKIGGG